MPVLDGIRGLAVLMVLVFHFVGNTVATNKFESVVIAVSNYGAYGVELFFVLSGFLITGILYDSSQRQHYFRNFIMRRALRIFPLYYSVLVLVFFVAPLIPALRGETLDYLVDRQGWAWLFAVNIYIGKQGEWSFSYLNHFWSLAVEEHFYLFWPLIVFLLAGRSKRLIVVCLAIALGAMTSRLAGSLAGLSWWTTYVLTPFRLDGLALGAFVAVMARQPGGLDRLVSWLPRVLVIAGGGWALSYVWTRLMPGQALALVLPIRAALVQVLLASLLVWALTSSERSGISRFFRSRLMVTLGTYSYGLYVYHHFVSYYFSSNQIEFVLTQKIGSHGIAVLVQATIGALLSFMMAYASYELFEKHFLKLKGLFGAAQRPE